MEPNNPRPTQDRIRDAAHGAIDKAVDSAAPAARWIDDKRNYLNDEQRQISEYMSSNPVKALAIVFVAGLLIGKILL